MANKKQTDLSMDQQADLMLFQQELLNRGWQPTGTFNALFEQGWAVPYQAEFSKKQRGFSLIVRYICADVGQANILNVTLHSNQDNQMVAIRFDRLDRATLDALFSTLEQLPQQGVRATLETLAESELNITVNIYDDYFPLGEGSLKRLYT